MTTIFTDYTLERDTLPGGSLELLVEGELEPVEPATYWHPGGGGSAYIVQAFTADGQPWEGQLTDAESAAALEKLYEAAEDWDV